jgi:hypothetical protein
VSNLLPALDEAARRMTETGNSAPMPMSEFRAANQLTWGATNKAVSILKAEKPRGAGLDNAARASVCNSRETRLRAMHPLPFPVN